VRRALSAETYWATLHGSPPGLLDPVLAQKPGRGGLEEAVLGPSSAWDFNEAAHRPQQGFGYLPPACFTTAGSGHRLGPWPSGGAIAAASRVR